MNIHCIETFFTVHDFWATCASLKKQLPWKFSLYWIYFLPFRIFEQLALALKKRVAINSPYWIYFLPFRIFEQLALAVKNRVCLEIFHCIEYTFYIQDFWSTCDCPEKQSVPWNFSRATCDCPENRVALEFFTVLNILFTIQDFGATCSCPGIFHCTEIYFIIQDFLLYRIYIFYYSGVLSNLRLPCKQSLPWNFSSPGERQPPDPPPRTPMPIVDTFFLVKLTRNCSSWFN